MTDVVRGETALLNWETRRGGGERAVSGSVPAEEKRRSPKHVRGKGGGDSLQQVPGEYF